MIVNIMIFALINMHTTGETEGAENKSKRKKEYLDQNEGKEMGLFGEMLFGSLKFFSRPSIRCDSAPVTFGYTLSATPANLAAIKAKILEVENTLTGLGLDTTKAARNTRHNFKNASGRKKTTGKDEIIIKQRIAKENQGSNLDIQKLTTELGILRMQRDNMEADLNKQQNE